MCAVKLFIVLPPSMLCKPHIGVFIHNGYMKFNPALLLSSLVDCNNCILCMYLLKSAWDGDFCMFSYVWFDDILKGLVAWHLVMKRLYIGGLGHTVSEKDLKDRFGKFGDVSDVEIIRRKDEQGRNSDENQINWFWIYFFFYIHWVPVQYYSAFVHYICDLFAGSPLKTFGYININITDAEYKRCTCIYLTFNFT